MNVAQNAHDVTAGPAGLFRKYIGGQAIRKIASGAAMIAATLFPAAAQDQIVLRASHQFPNELYIWKQGPQVLLDEVEKASNGRVRFEVFPAGQLGRDTVSLLESSLVDIALLIPSYTPDKLPLSSVAELPGLFSNSCEGTEKLWRVARPGEALHEAEYSPKGVHLLMVNVLPPYSLMTTKRSPDNLEALRGLKFRANGNSMLKTVTALRGVPVQVPTTELYDSLSRGTVDGTLSSYLALPDYDLQKQLRYSVEGPRLGGGSISLGIRKQVWDAFPDDIKQIFEEAGAVAQQKMCEWEEQTNADIRARIVEEDGHTVVTLSPAEVELWEEHVSDVSETWSAEIAASGRDGSAILEAFQTE